MRLRTTLSNELPDDILEAVASETGLPQHVVERIVRHQFKFLKDTMQSGEFRSLRLQGLGVFLPKKLFNEKGNRTSSDSGLIQGSGEDES